MADDFPADVRQFLLNQITSVEQLEILLLLRAEPGKDWTAESVSKALYSSPSAAQMRLADLLSRRLVTAGGAPNTFCYRNTDPASDERLARLAALYKERRVAVIGLVYSKETAQVQAFADAFRLRKD